MKGIIGIDTLVSHGKERNYHVRYPRDYFFHLATSCFDYLHKQANDFSHANVNKTQGMNLLKGPPF